MNQVKKASSFKEEVVKLFSKQELLFLPGELAFSLVLAIVPVLSIAVALASRINLSLDFAYNFLQTTFSVGVADFVVELFTSQNVSIGSIITILFALYVSSNGFNAVILSADIMYGLKPTPIIKRRIKALLLTIFFFILILFILLVPVFGKFIVDAISIVINDAKLIDLLYRLLSLLKWPITLLLVLIFVKIIYTLAPNEIIPSKYSNIGSLFTTILFLVISLLYSYYVNNIARYDLLYGNFANLIMLLFWFYLMSYIFVLGLAINEKGYILYKKEKSKKS